MKKSNQTKSTHNAKQHATKRHNECTNMHANTTTHANNMPNQCKQNASKRHTKYKKRKCNTHAQHMHNNVHQMKKRKQKAQTHATNKKTHTTNFT